MTNRRTIIRTVYAPGRLRRVVVFRRTDGSFGFEEQHYASEALEECWVYGPKHTECRCPTEEIVLRECIGRVDWLADCIASGREIDGLPRPRVKAPPPNEISGMPVVCFTPIDQRHRHTENCPQIIAEEVQGPAAGMLICRCDEEDAYYLFGCDAEWGTVTDTWHQSLADAKRQAELEYTGISRTWQVLPDNHPQRSDESRKT